MWCMEVSYSVQWAQPPSVLLLPVGFGISLRTDFRQTCLCRGRERMRNQTSLLAFLARTKDILV